MPVAPDKVVAEMMEVTSEQSIKLDPHSLTCCTHALSVLALLLTTTIYLCIGQLALELFGFWERFSIAGSVLLVTLPFYVFSFLGAFHKVGLIRRPDAELRLRDCAPGAAIPELTGMKILERTLRTDMTALGLYRPIELLYRENGAPYTFRFFADHKIVLSFQWLRVMCRSYSTETEFAQGARAVLLHELGHVQGKDTVLLGLTGIMSVAIMLLGGIVCIYNASLIELLWWLPIWLVICLLNSYVGRRREVFADMVAAKAQRTLEHIESQLRICADNSLDLQLHGPVAITGQGFVSSQRHSSRIRFFTKLFAAILGHYFDVRQRLAFLRQGRGQFANLATGDLLLLGVIGVMWPLCASTLTLTLLSREMLAVPVMSLATMIHVYLLFRVSTAYSLVASPEERLPVEKVVAYYWVGGALGATIILWPIMLVEGGLILAAQFMLVAMWNAFAFYSYIDGSRLYYGSNADRFHSSSRLRALAYAVATGGLHATQFLAGMYYGPEGASITASWIILIAYCLLLESVKHVWKFWRSPHSFWLCHGCGQKNDVLNTQDLSTIQNGRESEDPLGVYRACRHCRRLKLEGLVAVID